MHECNNLYMFTEQACRFSMVTSCILVLDVLPLYQDRSKLVNELHVAITMSITDCEFYMYIAKLLSADDSVRSKC